MEWPIELEAAGSYSCPIKADFELPGSDHQDIINTDWVLDMTWCCHFVQNAFQSRLQYGEFIVAGRDSQSGQVVFLSGFNMCHRKNYADVIAATRRAAQVIESEGISNFKLSEHSCVHFCKRCGANLREHYGEEGGLLRDDSYVQELQTA